MRIFDYLDYRSFLKDEFAARKRDEPGFTISGLAELCGIRNTYLNNVVHAKNNLNSDQVYALAKHLRFSPLETQYFFLLKELDQTLLPDRKAELSLQLEKIRQAAVKTESNISAKVVEADPADIMRYYANPLNKIVHLVVQIPRYARNPDSLASSLNIPEVQLREVLTTLVDLGIIKYKEKSVEVLRKNYHLPKASPMLLPHQALMRARSTERLLQLPLDKRYSFSVTFSTNTQTKDFVHAQFLEFLKRIDPEVKASDGDNAYQINFDLFPWTEEF